MNEAAKRLVKLRAATHGDFDERSRIVMGILNLWQTSPNWPRLSNSQRMALYEIANKTSRILCGNPDFEDHWNDIAGYTELVVKVQSPPDME